jgi:hypothetical protein
MFRLSSCLLILGFVVCTFRLMGLILAIDVFRLDVHEGYQTVFGLASAVMRYR